MEVNASVSLAINVVEPSQTGEARRKAVALSIQLGFDLTQQSNIGIIVTELANNLVRHAQEGSLLLRPLECNGKIGIEILSLDKGPGINNIDACMQDGFSTIGTSGNGLGAIQRLSGLFEIYSVIDEGTAILCQLWTDMLVHSPSEGLNIGVVCLPIAGEEVSGDAWSSQTYGNQQQLMIADGLGHGENAAIASQEAVRIFQLNPHHSPPDILEIAHTALRSTRGAAVAIATIKLSDQTIQYAGVGNISSSVHSFDHSTSMVSHNGTIGHEARKFQSFNYSWASNAVMIMHSDGLSTHWQLDRYPGLFFKHPSLIAGILYRDFSRGRDDVTVLVAREVERA